MRNEIVFLFMLLAVAFKTRAQTTLCNGAAPFCTGTTYNFPALTSSMSAQPGVDYGCLLTTPNPVWYYLKVGTPGTIVLNISGVNSLDDIDFVCWGPFTDATSACTAQLTNLCRGVGIGCPSNGNAPPGLYPSGNMVDCSYSLQPTETCTIPNALAGQFYLVLITNFAGNNTNIVFNQTNIGVPGAGSTDCSIVLCAIHALTAVPSGCNQANNTYTLTGTVSFTNAPSTGSLIVTNSCGANQVFTAPFTNPLTYAFPGLVSNGKACSVNASFSAGNGCTKTTAYTAPVSCVSCTATASNNSPVCELQALNLVSSSPNASITTWSGPNNYISSLVSPTLVSAGIKASGIYTVTVLSVNTATCSATTSVIVRPLPVPDFSLTVPKEEGNYTISGTNLSVGSSYFYWNLENGKQIFTNDIDYDFKDKGKYPVCLYTENSFGCSATKCTVVDFKEWSFYVPDSFTPNHDHVNDRFYVYGYGISEVHLEVYNRWGSKVFSGNGLEDGWSGTTEGEDQPVKQDTYTWKVSFKDVDNLQHNYVGHVTLLK